MRQGKCTQLEDGRLALPNGRFLPRYVQGVTMQERFDKYAADYAGFAAEGRPAEGMMWSVTGMQYEQGPEVAEGEMLAVE